MSADVKGLEIFKKREFFWRFLGLRRTPKGLGKFYFPASLSSQGKTFCYDVTVTCLTSQRCRHSCCLQPWSRTTEGVIDAHSQIQNFRVIGQTVWASGIRSRIRKVLENGKEVVGKISGVWINGLCDSSPNFDLIRLFVEEDGDRDGPCADNYHTPSCQNLPESSLRWETCYSCVVHRPTPPLLLLDILCDTRADICARLRHSQRFLFQVTVQESIRSSRL